MATRQAPSLDLSVPAEQRGHAMSRSEPSSTPEETPWTHEPQGRPAHLLSPRRGLRRSLGLLAGLIVMAVLAAFAYNFATSYFALNGAWYGPLQVQVGPSRVSLEAYLSLSTSLNGHLSGSGKLCSSNLFGSGTSTIDLTVAGGGDRQRGTVALSLAGSTSTLGIPLLSIALGPELDLHGRYMTDSSARSVAGILINGVAAAVRVNGGSSAFPVTLAMKRGVVAQFAAACSARSTLGDASGAGG
jgi:hypothetical protein